MKQILAILLALGLSACATAPKPRFYNVICATPMGPFAVQALSGARIGNLDKPQALTYELTLPNGSFVIMPKTSCVLDREELPFRAGSDSEEE